MPLVLFLAIPGLFLSRLPHLDQLFFLHPNRLVASPRYKRPCLSVYSLIQVILLDSFDLPRSIEAQLVAGTDNIPYVSSNPR